MFMYSLCVIPINYLCFFAIFILIGADYNPASNPSGFSFGSSSGNMLCTSVSIVPDSDYEMDEENLFADLSMPQNSRVILSPPQTEVVIADDDSKFKLNGKKIVIMDHSFADITIGFNPATDSVRENEGFINLVVEVLEGNLQTNIDIRLDTRDGTAVCKS